MDAEDGGELETGTGITGLPANTQAAINAVSQFMEDEGTKRGGFGEALKSRLSESAQITGRDMERRRLGDMVTVGMGAADQASALTPDQSAGIMNIGMSRAAAGQRAATQHQNTVSRALDEVSGAPAYVTADRYNRSQKYDPVTAQSMKYGGF